jgi:dTDP-4-amino-4,6-dideoxygalactose transaminase/CelD/BcsL family acetyltransferase involved in cellulose biosynthesis
VTSRSTTRRSRLDVWAPLPPAAYLYPRTTPPFPLGEPGVALFARARQGLFAGVRALGLEPGDEILTPAYHHGSEVEALLRAGLVTRFYDATATLEPDTSELGELLGPRTRALYLIHYLGFPQDARRWRRFCDERGLLLLEDAAQAWLARSSDGPVGSLGDLAVFCIYKTYGLPDGAALLLRSGPTPAAPAAAHVGVRSLGARHALWLAQRSAVAGSLLAALERDGEYRADEDFALQSPAPPASSTSFLLARLGADAPPRRRAHYRLLLDELSAHVPRPFDRLPEGASPFAFPIASKRKGELIARLTRNGIRALDLWSACHPALPAGRFPGAASRRATTVGLPVHQELRPADIDRVLESVRQPSARRPPALEWVDEMEPLSAVWRSLATRSGNIFLAWEWASLWWRRYGLRGRLRVAACRRASGEPFALIPIYVWRERPLRIVRLLGHDTGDEQGPVCATEDRPAAARCLRRAIGELRADIFLGERLLATEAWSSLVGGAVVRREGFPLIRGFDGWEGYMASRTAHLRRKLAGQERRLARERGLQFRLVGRDDPLDADLDTLFALHRARWPEGTGFTEHEQFHREFARCALERDWLRLWLLELDGTPAAAWYGFRFADTECHFQSGRSPRFERESVGTVLLVHTIREALRDGVREYRFLRGGEPYKHRFATEDPGIETIACARTRAGRATVAAARAAAACRPARRALREVVTR